MFGINLFDELIKTEPNSKLFKLAYSCPTLRHYFGEMKRHENIAILLNKSI